MQGRVRVPVGRLEPLGLDRREALALLGGEVRYWLGGLSRDHGFSSRGVRLGDPPSASTAVPRRTSAWLTTRNSAHAMSAMEPTSTALDGPMNWPSEPNARPEIGMIPMNDMTNRPITLPRR